MTRGGTSHLCVDFDPEDKYVDILFQPNKSHLGTYISVDIICYLQHVILSLKVHILLLFTTGVCTVRWFSEHSCSPSPV